MADNKVKFNLKNAHYALYDEDAGTYSTPVSVPGSVSLSLSPQGETTTEYADGYAYYVANSNQGYSGDWELEYIPDQMRVDLWGYTLNSTSKILTENADVEPSKFAFMFQIDGDAYNRCMTLYNCTATRPSLGGSTNQASKSIQHDTVTITAVPMSDGIVSSCTTKDTPDATVSAYFNAVTK